MTIQSKAEFISFLSQTFDYNNSLAQTNKSIIDTFLAFSSYIESGAGGNISGNANLIFATPNGVAGVAVLRALVSDDIPALDASKITTGEFNVNRLGSGASNSKYLRGDKTWNFVTETVSIVTPSSIFDEVKGYTGSAYSFTATLKEQLANTFFSAPNGSNGSPSFRGININDLPTITVAKGGTGLTALGSSGQSIKVNSGATGFEFYTPDDSQSLNLLWSKDITGITASELFLDGVSTQAVLSSGNTVWVAKIKVIATISSIGNGSGLVGNSFAGEYLVSIKRLGATTTLVGTVQTIGTTGDSTMVNSVVTITADDSNEALKITFTTDSNAAGSTTVTKVIAHGTIIEVTY